MSDQTATIDSAPLIACHECGLLHGIRELPHGASAKCGRCGARLYHARSNSIESCLLLTIAALILFTLANTFPFMTFTVEGREQVNTLFTGVQVLFDDGMWHLAGVVLAASIAAPGVKLGLTTYVLLPMHFGRRAPFTATVFRWVEILRPWAMMEVYLLGVLVAYVNLVKLGDLELGVAVFSFAVLIVVMVAADASLDAREVWDKIGPVTTARDLPSLAPARLVGCHSCDLVNPLPADPHSHHAHCRRCGAPLHKRKTNGVTRAWALLIAAVIMYIPANVYPVMTVISFGRGTPDTILSGVKHLIEGGLWPLAALVFFASVAVPMLKIIGLGFILISVQRKSNWRPRDRTVMYRIVEAIGRWSMIDIFMVSILVALVNLGAVATIEPGAGALAFASVVIITMIAAMLFDPKLIWDGAIDNKDREEVAHGVV